VLFEFEDLLTAIKPRKKEEIEKFGTLLYVLSQTVPELIHAKQVTEHLAQTDKLTGLYNRRYFIEALDKEIIRSKRFFKPISLILMDIDYFGKYNNNMGHPMGDVLLKKIAGLFKAYVRSVDVVGRYGGEEFIVILPECDEPDASIIAERLRKAIEIEKFEGGEGQPDGKVTVSVGCLTSRDLNLSSEELIKETDKALYQAKDTGRNKVVHKTMKNPAIEKIHKDSNNLINKSI